MNNPFDYTPSVRMLAEQQLLVAHIEKLRYQNATFREEVDKGKMFGILITTTKTLYAFSGQIGNSFSWPDFVPPVYDYLDETGHFKQSERKITALNNQIQDLEKSQKLASSRQNLDDIKQQSEHDISRYKQLINEAKALRDKKRSEGTADESECIRESQFMKAELHRKKLQWRSLLADAQKVVDDILVDIRQMKLQRQFMSDQLQRWLFEQFVFNDKNLMQIFAPDIPPSGSGECCEPKLLHYAMENGLEPMEIGMFWWGESPKQEIRHHLQFYPACNGKCKAIIKSLYSPTSSPSPTLPEREGDVNTQLQIIFEDESIIVVNKPSGMLSVPGKGNRESVYSILAASHPECKELAMVHRLDMDTSGILVVAKTKEAHKNLQKQFAEHTIRKEYIARLERPVEGSGIIELPLRPDYDDRPRQLVDFVYGKAAITEYKALNDNLILLIPHTGRTHQLRVHCAHISGLNNPIKGDRLYGSKSVPSSATRASRLYLHARKLEFTHPQTGKRVTYEAKAPF